MKFFGIEIGFHPSWLFLAFLGYMWGRGSAISASIDGFSLSVLSGFLGIFWLIFFLLMHERAHIYAGERYGIGCKGVIVFALGGVALMESVGKSAKETVVIAAAGPLSNFIAAAPLIVLYTFLNEPASPLLSFLSLQVKMAIQINLILGLFNLLLPIYPLDGGRIVHGIFWKLKGTGEKGRTAAITFARGVMVILAGILVWQFLIGNLNLLNLAWFGFLLAFVWYMQSAEKKHPEQNNSGENEDGDGNDPII